MFTILDIQQLKRMMERGHTIVVDEDTVDFLMRAVKYYKDIADRFTGARK